MLNCTKATSVTSNVHDNECYNDVQIQGCTPCKTVKHSVEIITLYWQTK